MLISRATMKTQLKGNKMKKKPVMKKNMGKMLEALSPVYSIAKGKGPVSQLASAGGLGLVPAMVARPQRKKAKARKAARMASAPQSPSAGMGMPEMTRRMAMGGTVKRSKSIDGIAMRGKTRAV